MAVNHLGIVGAGTMGGGIAQLAAFHGIRVRVRDLRREAVSLALGYAAKLFDGAVAKRRLTRQAADHAIELISGGQDHAGFGPSDVVVEAVVEKMDVKKTVLRELEAQVAESCILATNTSSLSVEEMATSLAAPGRFVGMHFFNPVHKMPLVEVIRGPQTTDGAVATIYALAIRMGKIPVVVRDGPGFLVNRILSPYLNEAGYLLGAGASIDSIDRAAESFGMPMGPLRLIDEVGIDVARHAGDTLHAAFGERLAPAPSLVAIGGSGRLGKKGGSGFYKYDDGQEPTADPAAYGLLGSNRTGTSATPSVDTTRDRLIVSMINEAARRAFGRDHLVSCRCGSGNDHGHRFPALPRGPPSVRR